MKKRIYFIISSIIIILISLYVIIFAKPIIESQLESINEIYSLLPFPDDFIQRVNTLLTKSGPPFLIITSSICVISNLVLLISAIKNNIAYKKGLLIFCSSMTFLFAPHLIINLLSIINVIIIACTKSLINKEEKVKKEIPRLERMNLKPIDIILSITLLIFYFSQWFWVDFIPNGLISIVRISFYVIMLAFSILVFWKTLKRDIKALISNFEAYIRYILPRYGIMYIVFIIVSLISILLSKTALSVNQSKVESLKLVELFVLAVLWAPIVEELLFRGVLRRLFKNNVLFIIASAVIFGLIHVISEATLYSAIVHALPYSVLGGFFAYLYSKTNNITNSMMCHAFHNLIATLLSLLLI